ncbi:hypothetical protein HPB48_008600 [Haemaphysalis longicornis]|uniref:non-specific serine/threonine protein kinase n=1 Tax=Haemaphysalis longicornis TaxID=44386 RepID=A0A9J6GRP2_HAELO|nr:hypothetical protein HPB48_008600 [Haemaphysalis longicornis]
MPLRGATVAEVLPKGTSRLMCRPLSFPPLVPDRGIVQELRQLRVSIADFEVKAVIGRGHFGDIHMVKEKATGDIYAMKILRKDDTLSQREVAFFEEERDILARAGQSGPWLTRLQYAFQDSAHLYLVMELLPGGDLFGLLDRSGGLLPEGDARFYLAELTLAVHALHSLGYVHRDVKPDNVLIDRTGHIKLADFGSAAKLADKKSVSASSLQLRREEHARLKCHVGKLTCSCPILFGQLSNRLPVGTPHYVAPEVLSAMGGGGLAACATAQGSTGCDWWSLGVLAYEMLYGQNPFADDRVLVTYNKIMNFQESLVYPDDSNVSATAVKMLRGLLAPADKRFSYEDMCRHEFFAPIDLHNIRQTVPPFVPNLSGEEDTSNFYEFEHEPARPRNPALRDQKKGFEGTNLPFIGFTHTQNANSAALESLFHLQVLLLHPLPLPSSPVFPGCRTVSFLEAGSSPLREPLLSSGASLRRRSQRQEQLLSEVTQREEGLRQEARECRTRLEQAQAQLATLEASLAAAEAREAQMRSDNQNLNMLVDLERKNRLVSEEKAVQLLNAIKRKYRRQDELLRSGYFVASPRKTTPRPFVVDVGVEGEANGGGGRGREEEEEREEEGDEASVQSELQLLHRQKAHLEEELANERALCAGYKEQLNSVLSEGVQCMEAMQKKHTADRVSIDEVRKEVSEAVCKQRQAEEALSACRSECAQHQTTVCGLEKEVAFLRGQVSASMDRAAPGREQPAVVTANGTAAASSATCQQCAVSMAELKRAAEEKAKLHREVAELKSQHQRLVESWEAQRRRDSLLQREANGLHSVVARLEGVVSTVEATCADSGSPHHHQPPPEQVQELESLRQRTSALEEANAHYLENIEKLNLRCHRGGVPGLLSPTSRSGASSSLEAEHKALLESSSALEAQLARTRDFLSTSRTRCGELQALLRKKEEELGSCQLEGRMAQREVKRLEESERLAREQRDRLQEEMAKLQAQAEELRAAGAAARGLPGPRPEGGHHGQDHLRAWLPVRQLQFSRFALEATSTKDLEAKCVSKADECRELTVKCKLEAQREAEVRSKVVSSSKELEELLRHERDKNAKLLKSIDVLKVTCNELDKQATDFEVQLNSAEKKNEELESERATHKEAVEKLNKKIFELKESLLLEKTARKRLEEEVGERAQGEREADAALDSLQSHLRERESLVRELGDQVAELRRPAGLPRGGRQGLAAQGGRLPAGGGRHQGGGGWATTLGGALLVLTREEWDESSACFTPGYLESLVVDAPPHVTALVR